MATPPTDPSVVNPITKWVRIGDYPVGYDPAKHGPYNPSRYYGPADTPFGELKIKEIPAWIGRRNLTPQGVAGLFSRALWRWQMTWVLPRKSSPAPIFQFFIAGSTLFYLLNYLRLRGHRSYKYH
ncbi:ATP synthase, subunit F [Osmia lignaria lignaria]|uniref:ATP synthase, subunit F n=1 Tax=Osmia lignaria lignaria TaxID=1437193 RepID=UPI0014798095|nr:putative ATP synthase subunit f, mitochondrial [Osmia lignaria]